MNINIPEPPVDPPDEDMSWIKPCPVCGSTDYLYVFRNSELYIVGCDECLKQIRYTDF